MTDDGRPRRLAMPRLDPALPEEVRQALVHLRERALEGSCPCGAAALVSGADQPGDSVSMLIHRAGCPIQDRLDDALARHGLHADVVEGELIPLEEADDQSALEVIPATAVSRIAWAHGEALCPSCRFPIDSRDVDEELREVGKA